MAKLNRKRLEQPLNTSDISILDGLQGNILKGHGRKYSAALFVVLPEEEQTAIELIAGLEPITSARVQSEQTERWNRAGDNEETFMMLGLSGRCYDRFNLERFGAPASPENVPELQSDREGFGRRAFNNGMRSAVDVPYQPPEEGWRPDDQRWRGTFKNNRFDLFLLVAHDRQLALNAKVDELQTQLKLSGAPVVHSVKGRQSAQESNLHRPVNEREAAVEHFGFVDGISNPSFVAEHGFEGTPLKAVLWPEAKPKDDPSHEEEVPKRNEDGSFGSFVSVLKLEQDVKGFKERARELGERLNYSGDAEALAVGREKDGTPLVNSLGMNDFDYRDDPDNNNRGGTKVCPFSAHIRRMNPRRESSKGLVIARRGFHYGESWLDNKEDGNERPDPPSGGVGLVFIGFASTLNPFINLMSATRNPPGAVDALIGRPQDAPADEQQWYRQDTRDWISFEMGNFVTECGGEYFFVPSMDFLRRINEGNGTDSGFGTTT